MELQLLGRLTQLIQFLHPEKMLAGLPGVTQLNNAALFALDEATYDTIRRGFDSSVQRAAVALLKQPGVAAQIKQLPFKRNDVVVGLGDSITDDFQSWLEILRAMLRLSRPEDDIRLVNAGVSGDTSAQLLARFSAVVALQPAWIICLAGTNDARRHGPHPWNVPVSPGETAKNLTALRNWARAASSARWVWMTPPPVISEQIATYWQTKLLQLQWYNSDLTAIADVIRQQPEPVVDLQEAFGSAADTSLLLEDGLHPSLTGQSLIVRALLDCLAPPSQAPGRSR